MTVGADGCEVDNPTDPEGNTTLPGDTTNPEGNTTLPGDGTDDSQTDGVDEPGDQSDVTGVKSNSDILGMSPIVVYGIAGVVIIALLSMLLLRGRSSGESSAFAQQEMAYGSAALPVADPTITAEQLAYEQQLVASGYPADYARAYADQHFRPWLQN